MMGRVAGQQNFLAVYAPATAQWSLKEAASPDEVKLRPGPDFTDARIAPATAARIKDRLNREATLVTFSGDQVAGTFLLELTETPSSTRLLSHRITLNQAAQSAIR